MNTIIGTCRYCGQSQMSNASASKDADRRATAYCKCEGAEHARLKRSVDMMLRELFCDPAGGDDQLYRMPDDEAMELIRKTCDNAIEGRIGRTTIRLPYSRQLTIRGYIDRVEIQLSQTRSLTGNSKNYYTYNPDETDREDG